jgi:hypothetical protein
MVTLRGWEAFEKEKEAGKENTIPFLSTVWRHSRKWAIPIPKGTRELLDPNQLYKIRISFTTPEDSHLDDLVREIFSGVGLKSYVEVTKVWKSGNRRLFPITKSTARQLVPKLQKLRENAEIILREATIQKAIDYLIKEDPRYKELRREIVRVNGPLWDILTPEQKEEQQKLREALAKLREEYRPKAEKLVEEGFKADPELEFIKEWIKAPLLIEATPYEVENERKAIALYKRAPILLTEEDDQRMY